MSWIQFGGETWPVTSDQAELRLLLWPPDSGYPRPSWNFDLLYDYCPPKAAPDDDEQTRWLSVEITDLFFHETDWRRLSRHEIHATPAWHEMHEHFHRHQRMVESRVKLSRKQVRRSPDEPRKPVGQEYWFAHDFILRFGTRDRFYFPCELDAWMIHEDDYRRTEPESPADIAPFPSTPPNLRLITRALFVGGGVEVPRSGSGDPVAAARELLREAIAYDEKLREPKVKWAVRFSPDHKEIVPMIGGASTVSFSTGASIYQPVPAGPPLPPGEPPR